MAAAADAATETAAGKRWPAPASHSVSPTRARFTQGAALSTLFPPITILPTQLLLRIAVSSDPFVADIVLIASHREHGNSHFKAKRYAEAIASYETALAANIETGGVVLQQQLQEQLLLCNLNAAACYLKIADPRSAKQRCDTALELDATSNKGLYRRAAAHFELRE